MTQAQRASIGCPRVSEPLHGKQLPPRSKPGALAGPDSAVYQEHQLPRKVAEVWSGHKVLWTRTPRTISSRPGGAPRWRESPKPRNEWLARDSRDAWPQPDPVALPTDPEGHPRAWVEPGPPPGGEAETGWAEAAAAWDWPETSTKCGGRRAGPGQALSGPVGLTWLRGRCVDSEKQDQGGEQVHEALWHKPQVRAPLAPPSPPACSPHGPHLGAALGGPGLRGSAPSAAGRPLSQLRSGCRGDRAAGGAGQGARRWAGGERTAQGARGAGTGQGSGREGGGSEGRVGLETRGRG